MPDPVILVLSADPHFSSVVSEQCRRELPGWQVAGEAASPALVIADNLPGKTYDCPVYVPESKPLRLQELLENVAALLHKPSSDSIALGRGYALQLKQKHLTHGGRIAELTEKEAQLLQCLIDGKGESVPREHLLKTVWGIESVLDTHTLETHIYRLRGKFRELAGDEMILATEGGYGCGHKG